ncbi:MAG: division/cell wall cluster transcriptional repressor MraZ, partial [Clostridia bacterium]|nr:division/cell wall cluster transcriptional repressor MraZ [Clostridia bacterium]
SVECDSQGRILIPNSLREYALLENDAHIIGMSTNLEIWNTQLWEEEKKQYTPEDMAAVMEELDF